MRNLLNEIESYMLKEGYKKDGFIYMSIQRLSYVLGIDKTSIECIAKEIYWIDEKGLVSISDAHENQ